MKKISLSLMNNFQFKSVNLYSRIKFIIYFISPNIIIKKFIIQELIINSKLLIK